MQVKISRGAAKEVTAVYPIDDQTMEMVVRLPPTFPLRQVEVEGIKRVGLNEQQFRKMQLASQAVINFQVGIITPLFTSQVVRCKKKLTRVEPYRVHRLSTV